jgi:hypothetical protein
MDSELMATDQFNRTQLDWGRIARTKTWSFTNLDSPYVGCFIMDQSLAREYTASRSFDSQLSASVKNWDIRERAAMGLTFEGIPRLFWHRLVIAFDGRNLQIPAFAYVYHAPANYANDPGTKPASLRVTDLLIAPSLGNFIRERSRSVARLFFR